MLKSEIALEVAEEHKQLCELNLDSRWIFFNHDLGEHRCGEGLRLVPGPASVCRRSASLTPQTFGHETTDFNGLRPCSSSDTNIMHPFPCTSSSQRAHFGSERVTTCHARALAHHRYASELPSASDVPYRDGMHGSLKGICAPRAELGESPAAQSLEDAGNEHAVADL